MARFILLTPIVGGPIKYPSGTTVADSTANAVGNDVVWPQLCAHPTPLAMAPLDAAAQALLPGNPPIYPSSTYYSNTTAFGVGGCGSLADRRQLTAPQLEGSRSDAHQTETEAQTEHQVANAQADAQGQSPR
jgi:hypothetical protein